MASLANTSERIPFGTTERMVAMARKPSLDVRASADTVEYRVVLPHQGSKLKHLAMPNGHDHCGYESS